MSYCSFSRVQKLKLGLLLLAISVAGCTTPPGQLKNSDFVLRSVDLQRPVSNVVSDFYQGLRYCGPSSGGIIFVTHYGVPECSPSRPDGTVVCDLYVGGAYGGRSNVVLGRADFIPIKEGTRLELRIRNYAANKKTILDAWKQFATGQAHKVCQAE